MLGGDQINKIRIFLSHAGEDEIIAREIYNDLLAYEAILISKYSIEDYIKNIRKANESIADHDFAILVISDKYLRSLNCMHELANLIASNKLEDKYLPIVLQNTIEINIYDGSERVIYYRYWRDRLRVATNNLEEFPRNIDVLTQFNKIQIIESTLPKFFVVFDEFSNLNFLTLKKLNYKPILDRICNRTGIEANVLISHKNKKITNKTEIKPQPNSSNAPFNYSYSNSDIEMEQISGNPKKNKLKYKYVYLLLLLISISAFAYWSLYFQQPLRRLTKNSKENNLPTKSDTTKLSTISTHLPSGINHAPDANIQKNGIRQKFNDTLYNNHNLKQIADSENYLGNSNSSPDSISLEIRHPHKTAINQIENMHIDSTNLRDFEKQYFQAKKCMSNWYADTKNRNHIDSAIRYLRIPVKGNYEPAIKYMKLINRYNEGN